MTPHAPLAILPSNAAMQSDTVVARLVAARELDDEALQQDYEATTNAIIQRRIDEGKEEPDPPVTQVVLNPRELANEDGSICKRAVSSKFDYMSYHPSKNDGVRGSRDVRKEPLIPSDCSEDWNSDDCRLLAGLSGSDDSDGSDASEASLTGRASGGEEDEQGDGVASRTHRERRPPGEFWKVGGAAPAPLSAKAAGKRRMAAEPVAMGQAPPANKQARQAGSLANQCAKPAKQPRRVQPTSISVPEGEAGPSSSGPAMCEVCHERPAGNIDPNWRKDMETHRCVRCGRHWLRHKTEWTDTVRKGRPSAIRSQY